VKTVSSVRPQADPELVYDALLEHFGRCPTCWPWRDYPALYHRLCLFGKALLETYAEAVVAADRELEG
jgi:hypothetical protein